MHLENKVKNVSRRNCICKSKECKKISNIFQELGDVRGDFATVPNPKSSTRKSNSAESSQFFNDRLRRHYTIHNEVFSELCYHKDTPNIITRKNATVQNKRNAYFALHHYHPRLLKTFEKEVVKKKFLPTEMLKSLNHYDPKGGCIYSLADVEKSSGFVAVVPNYLNTEATMRDIEDCRSSKNLHENIEAAHLAASKNKRKRSVCNSQNVTGPKVITPEKKENKSPPRKKENKKPRLVIVNQKLKNSKYSWKN